MSNKNNKGTSITDTLPAPAATGGGESPAILPTQAPSREATLTGLKNILDSAAVVYNARLDGGLDEIPGTGYHDERMHAHHLVANYNGIGYRVLDIDEKTLSAILVARMDGPDSGRDQMGPLAEDYVTRVKRYLDDEIDFDPRAGLPVMEMVYPDPRQQAA